MPKDGIGALGVSVKPGTVYRVNTTLIGRRGTQLAPYVMIEYQDPCSSKTVQVWHNAGISVEYPRVGALYIVVSGFTDGILTTEVITYSTECNRSRRIDVLDKTFVPWTTNVVAPPGGTPTAPGSEWARCNGIALLDGASYPANTIIPVIDDVPIIASREGDKLTSWTRL